MGDVAAKQPMQWRRGQASQEGQPLMRPLRIRLTKEALGSAVPPEPRETSPVMGDAPSGPPDLTSPEPSQDIDGLGLTVLLGMTPQLLPNSEYVPGVLAGAGLWCPSEGLGTWAQRRHLRRQHAASLINEQLPYGSPDSPLASLSRKPPASSMGGSYRAPSWPVEQAELEAARSQQAWSLWAPMDISEHQ